MFQEPMIAFVHINKTAGTSVKFILRNTFGVRHCDAVSLDPEGVFTAEEFRFARRFFPGLRSLSGHPVRHPSAHLPADVQLFTFLRDPVVRCASHFQQIQRGDRSRRSKYRSGRRSSRKPSFEEFVHDSRYRDLQVQRIVGCADAEKAKHEIETRYFFVGLTERFRESIRMLQKLSPYPIDPRYRRLKVAPDDTLKNRLLADPLTSRMLQEANEGDRALYDYVRAVVYPDRLKDVQAACEAVLPEPEEIDFAPLRYRVNRLYNNLVYREAMRWRRRLASRTN